MKKIMFNDRYGLTRKVLNGYKTQTRRVIPDIEIDWVRRGKVHLPVGGFENDVLFMNVRSILPDAGISDYPAPAKYQPKYEKGEEIAVAQCYEDAILDVGEEEWNKQHKWYCIENLRKRAGLHNKMFVRPDLMPHRIKITDIRLQRLNNISEEECMREGVVKWMDCYIVAGIMENRGRNNVCFDTPREAFAALIDRINGKGTWESNPWVYAYTFELVR